MRDNRDDVMYDINNLMDKIRTEFYELLEYDPDAVSSPEKDRRRREVLHLINDLRIHAEQL